jgi:hypothetical protein
MCSDKPNTRPWDDPEEHLDDEAVLALLYGKYPRMHEDMALYANIMGRGAAFSIGVAQVTHCLCLMFIQLHIRTPRWVKRATYYAGCFLIGFTIASGIMWVVTSLVFPT